jgi:hypothetical protein
MDRARPGPAETPVSFNLQVDIVSPRGADPVIAGRVIPVRVHAWENGGRLNGVGLLARRFDNNARLDSTVVTFSARNDTTHVFNLRVPDNFPHNGQIDLRGMAFGQTQSRTSVPRAVVVINCPTCL